MSDERERKIRVGLQRELQRLNVEVEAIDLVEDIPVLEAFVDDFAEALISDARAEGASWAAIAARLGVSRQAVHKRFASSRKVRRGTVIELRFRRDKD